MSQHLDGNLEGSDYITLLPLRSKSVEFNAQENVWQCLRNNWPSNRISTSYDNIVDPCCHARNRLIDDSWRSISLALRDRAHRFRDMQVL